MSYRPQTPIPIDCQFTLLSCKLNLNHKKSNLNKIKSEKTIIHRPNLKNQFQQRTSLKFNKQSKTFQNIHHKSNLPSHRLTNYQNNTQQLSTSKQHTLQHSKHQNNQPLRQTFPTNLNPQTLSQYSIKKPQRLSTIATQSPIHHHPYHHTNIFTDQITLNNNPKDISQWKDRNTTNTNTNTNTKINFINQPYLINIKRRVMTEQNTTDVKKHIYDSSNLCQIPSDIAYRSELVNSINIRQDNEKTYKKYLQKNIKLKKSQYLQNIQNISMKQSSPLTTQISYKNINNNIHNSQIYHYKIQPTPQFRISTQQSPQIILDSHIRKQLSPKFIKKFNTLTQFNLKCTQSYGDLQSFNKASIIISNDQSFISQSNSDFKLLGNFNKIINFMNLQKIS